MSSFISMTGNVQSYDISGIFMLTPTNWIIQLSEFIQDTGPRASQPQFSVMSL